MVLEYMSWEALDTGDDRMSKAHLTGMTAALGLVGIGFLIELLSLDHGNPPLLVAVFLVAAVPPVVLAFEAEQFDRQAPPLVNSVAVYVVFAVLFGPLILVFVPLEPVTVFLERRFLVGQLQIALISGVCLGFAAHFGLRLRERRY